MMVVVEQYSRLRKNSNFFDSLKLDNFGSAIWVTRVVHKPGAGLAKFSQQCKHLPCYIALLGCIHHKLSINPEQVRRSDPNCFISADKCSVAANTTIEVYLPVLSDISQSVANQFTDVFNHHLLLRDWFLQAQSAT